MLRIALLASAMLLPAVAFAQPVHGLYLGGEIGANFASSMLSSDETTKVDTNLGPVELVGLGWGFGNGLRTEIEGSYRSNSIGNISTRRVNGYLQPLTNVGGNVSTYAVMANVAYDIPISGLGLGLPLQPYVGAGVGYGWLQFNNAGGNGLLQLALPQNNTYVGPDSVTFGNAGAFAYQAIVGMSLPLRFLPGLDATLEYRFFGMARADVPVNRVATNNNTINGVLPSVSTRNGFDVQDHTIMLGVRYRFSTP